MPTYSVVTLPQPERISSILRGSNNKLSMIDGRNDSQVIFYDQVIPGSTPGRLPQCRPLGDRRADRAHARHDRLAVRHQNAYPREALLEAVLRFVEEDLAARGK